MCVFVCTVKDCSPLYPPQNGALACSTWSNGPICQVQCNVNYDIPDSDPVLYDPDRLGMMLGMFVCSTTDGIWKPKYIINNCTGLCI